MESKKIRLQKYLSACGVASRRKAEDMILQGRVKVNGRAASLGDQILPQKDTVMVAGKKIVPPRACQYIMLHKPRGFITTLQDERGRKSAAQLVAEAGTRLYPVGRLDKDSEGLLLFTNDGTFANAMMHPARHVSKTYRVTVRPGITEEQLTALMTGIVIDDVKTAPAEVHVIRKEEGKAVLQIILYEGRNRQIRKMCEQIGLDVIRLKRIAIGTVKLGMLPIGKWRALSEQELHKLQHACGQKQEV